MAKKEGIGSIDDLFTSKDRLKKGKNSTGFKSTTSLKASKPTTIKELITNKKAPEVMVKISGNSKDMGRLGSHIDYISRNGEVDLIDNNGNSLKGMDEVKDIKKQFASLGLPIENGKYREAFHIVLSMPPNTDPDRMYKAVKNFASEEFANNKYVMAQHLDEKHPHVHICVIARDMDGNRLNPRKNDLQSWREQFAQKLKEQGIEANATKRIQRFKYKKPEKQNVRNWKEEAKGNFKNGRNYRKRDLPDSYKNRFQKIAATKEMPDNLYKDYLLSAYKLIIDDLKKTLPDEVIKSKDFAEYEQKSKSIEPTAEQKLFLEIQKQSLEKLNELNKSKNSNEIIKKGIER